MDVDTYLTVEEAAELARCGPKTVRRAVSAGELPALPAGGRLLMSQDAVRGWIESRPASMSAPGRRSARASGRAQGTVAKLREIERRGGQTLRQ